VLPASLSLYLHLRYHPRNSSLVVRLGKGRTAATGGLKNPEMLRPSAEICSGLQQSFLTFFVDKGLTGRYVPTFTE
jgi:hypothetical protein